MRRTVILVAAVLSAAMIALGQQDASALGDAKAGDCGFANSGTASGNALNCYYGISEKTLEGLVQERTKPLEDLTTAQKDTIALLKEKLDINERQIRAAFDVLGEKDIQPERLAAKLVEVANQYKALKESASALPGDDAKTAALKAEAQRAIEDGRLAEADRLLAEAQREESAALDRLALNSAETAARRGDIALTRLRYDEAAQRFAEAAAVLPPNGGHEDKRMDYLEREANALFKQGDEFGDNEALKAAITRERRLLEMQPRGRVPLDWAQTQMNLGNALVRLGQRESGTARLEEAVAAYRAALEVQTREQVPLDWAGAQMNLGNALESLGERESGTVRLEEAVAAYRAALEELTRERVPLDWAMTQMNLGNALVRLGEGEGGTARLEQAVAAYRAALEERTRERVPLDWAQTQVDLGNALVRLGEREGGTARLEQAVAAYRAALEELTRERVPLYWATTQVSLGVALLTLSEGESGTARLEQAVAAYRAALEERTRERVPLDWAATQMNLGNALVRLGERDSATGRGGHRLSRGAGGTDARTGPARLGADAG